MKYPDNRKIRGFALCDNINFSSAYFLWRMSKRKISMQELKEALLNCTIVEVQYYQEIRLLVNGYTKESKALHLVLVVKASGDGSRLKAVTAYYPSFDIWDTPTSRRKAA